MAISKVQTKAASVSSGTSVAAAFTSNVTKNNLLIAVFGGGGSVTFGTNTVTDTQGNTWTLAIASTAVDSNASVWIYWAIAGSTGANTVTWSSTGAAGTMNLNVAEYSGLATASPVDKTGSGQGQSDGSLSITQALELVIAGVGNNQTGTWSADQSFTVESQTATASDSCAFADRITSAIGSYTTHFTNSGGADLPSTGFGIVSFKGGQAASKLEIALFGTKRYRQSRPAAKCTEFMPEKPVTLFEEE